jgi:GNAT superfamily N-acetyltransferase
MIVKNAPAIHQLKFRHFRGENDYPNLAAVLTASENADQIERKVTAEDIANAYQHLTNCDPYADMIIAEVVGEIVGYSRGWWGDESPKWRLYEHNGFLLPEWRRKGIGHSMLLWTENRLRDIAATHPPNDEKLFQVNVSHYQKGTSFLLADAGYRPIRYFFDMLRPNLNNIPDSPLPGGLELRPVSPDHYHAIWKSVDETSQDEWGYIKSTDDDYHTWQKHAHFQRHLWQIAWDLAANQVVGHVLTFIDDDENVQFNRKRGYTEGIGIDRSWRRRGLARGLIVRSLQAQKSAGMTESALTADCDGNSGVIRLYESCGLKIANRTTVYRKPMKAVNAAQPILHRKWVGHELT